MAITIRQEPSEYSPVYNELKFVVSSTNTSQANFRFICDVYVNGSSDYIARLDTVPNPTYGTGVFDVARIIESYVTHDFDVDSVASKKCENSTAYYQCKFGEEYGLASSGTTVYPNMTNSSTKYTWNGVFDWEDWNSYDQNKYKTNQASSQWLTSAPNNKKVYIDSNYSSGNEFLYCLNDTSGNVYFMDVDTYDSNGVAVGSYRVENLYQNSPSNGKMISFPSGYNMNNISASHIQVASGTLPIIGSTVASYTIYASDYSGTTTINVPKTFTVDRSCSKYQLYEIYFLNKLGGYDTFVFNFKSIHRADIKRSNYKSVMGRLTSAYVYTNSVNQRGVTQYDTTVEDIITLKSDYIDEDTMLWLEELVTSPDVYMLKNGEEVPIIITNAQFERKKTINDKIFNLSIDIKFSYRRYRQRY